MHADPGRRRPSHVSPGRPTGRSEAGAYAASRQDPPSVAWLSRARLLAAALLLPLWMTGAATAGDGRATVRPADAGAPPADHPRTNRPIPAPEFGHTLGDPDAPVTVVEFGDFACSACAVFARTVWPRVRSEWIETGRVFWHFVPFDVGLFDGSAAGQRAAACAAAQDEAAFWRFHDILYERQVEWTNAKQPATTFLRYANELGLDTGELATCYRENRVGESLDAANRAARRRNVRATPTFFINGEPVVGAYPYERFAAMLSEAGR